MKKFVYPFLFLLLITLIFVIPNIPLPFSFPLRINNLFISVYNRFTIWMPFIFLSGLILSCFITVFFKKYRYKGAKFLLFLFALMFICFLSTNYISPLLRDYSKGYVIERIEPVIKALDKYKKDNDAYPESLQLLSPHYIEKIPSTRVLTIKDVEYKRDNENYTLLFMQYINGWDVDIVMYNSNNKYDDDNSNLKKFGNWRYYFRN